MPKRDGIAIDQPCGCTVFIWKEGEVEITYCAKHGAAPALYEALVAIIDEANAHSTLYRKQLLNGRIDREARAALALVDGEQEAE